MNRSVADLLVCELAAAAAGSEAAGAAHEPEMALFNTTTHEGITITLSTASSSGSHGASLATSRIWPARGVRASAHVGTAPARSLRGPAGGSCLRYRLVRPRPFVPRIPLDHGNNAWALLPAGECYCPIRTSTHSRSRSACPQWRAAAPLVPHHPLPRTPALAPASPAVRHA